MRVTAITGEDPDAAIAAHAGLARRTHAAADNWAMVRRHNIEMVGLGKSLGWILQIPGRGVPAHALAVQWTAFDRAIAAAPNPATTIAGCGGLQALRDAVVARAGELRTAYESNVGAAAPDNYYTARRNALLASESQNYQKASCVPVLNAAMQALMDAMEREYDAGAIKATGTPKENYENTAAALAKAKQLIAARATADPAQAAYWSKFNKIKPLVEAAEASAGADPLTSRRKATFTRAYDAIKAKLGTAAPGRFADCTDLLPDLQAKAEAVLEQQVTALRGAVTATASKATANDQDKHLKAEAARTAIDGAHPQALARLTPEEQMSLLDSLRAEGMVPTGAANAADPKRMSMRKLYNAMEFEAKFITRDKANRKAVVETLMESNKAEFKAARENWTVMTQDQRAAVLQKVVDAQCRQANYAKPGGPTPGSSFTFYADAGDNDNGRYSVSRDSILINTAQPVFDDFELSVDLMFHENTHNYQRKLCDAVRNNTIGTADPPLTQAKMFYATWYAANAYVMGEESYDDYQKQPIEKHAWQAGPESAQMLMDAMDAP
jgi:hypothetical protein